MKYLKGSVCFTMKKILLSLTLIGASIASNAHGVDISSIVLVEQADNTWTLQIMSSLDAFRKEVKTHFSDSPYTTPEEFKEQLRAHFQKNLKIRVNDKEEVLLGKAVVQLGHETVVSYDGIAFPSNLTTIQIAGGVFKDIYKSKVKLLILKKGYFKQPFILNKKNNYTVDLQVNEKHFVLKDTAEEHFPYVPIGIGIGLLIVFIVFEFPKKACVLLSKSKS